MSILLWGWPPRLCMAPRNPIKKTLGWVSICILEYDRNKIRVSFYFDQTRVYIVHTQPKVFLIGFLGVIHRRWGQPRSNMLVKFYVHTYIYIRSIGRYIRTYPDHQTKVCEDACGGGKFHKNCWVLNCAMCTAVSREILWFQNSMLWAQSLWHLDT